MTYKLLEVEGLNLEDTPKKEDTKPIISESDNFEDYEKDLHSIATEYSKRVAEADQLKAKLDLQDLQNEEQYRELHGKWLSQIKRNTKLRKQNEAIQEKIDLLELKIKLDINNKI